MNLQHKGIQVTLGTIGILAEGYWQKDIGRRILTEELLRFFRFFTGGRFFVIMTILSADDRDCSAVRGDRKSRQRQQAVQETELITAREGRELPASCHTIWESD